MSTIKADTIQSRTTNGDLTISGNGTGVPNLETGTKLNSVALTGAATAAIPITVANGGTGSTSTTYCNLTSNVTGTLPVANGGTGATTHTANGVLIGEGTGAMTTVAPSTSGNVLTSDGTDWTSAAAGGGGAWSYISGVDVTEVTNIDFTGLDSTYEVYMWIFSGVMAVNFGASGINWRVGTGAGPTYQTTKHSYIIDKTKSGTPDDYSTVYAESGAYGIFCQEAGPGSSAAGNPSDGAYSYYGHLYLMGHANADQYARVLYKGCGIPLNGNDAPTSGKIQTADGLGYYFELDNVTAMRFFNQTQDWSSENSGTIKMYGLSPS